MEIKVNGSAKLHQVVSRSDSSVHIYRLVFKPFPMSSVEQDTSPCTEICIGW